MLAADDYHLEYGGESCRFALLVRCITKCKFRVSSVDAGGRRERGREGVRLHTCSRDVSSTLLRRLRWWGSGSTA